MKTLLCSFAAFFMFFGCVAHGQANHVPPICEQFSVNTESAIGVVGSPQDPDVALEHWNSKNKYSLIVSATKTAVPEANLDFAKVNGNFIAERLRDIGYTQLVEPITDEAATRDNFISALHQINNLPDTSLVVVYYSGHGVKGDNDEELFLQLYGSSLGSGFGLSVRDLISEARRSYEGELVIIIDACFSGHGALNSLTAKRLDKTIIISSSSEIQSSFVLNLPDNTQASAFSYFFTEAIMNDRFHSDFDKDGILEYEELVNYLQLRLDCAKLEGKITEKMDPKAFFNSRERFVAYDLTKVKNWNSAIRQKLVVEFLIRELKNGGRTTETVASTTHALTPTPTPSITITNDASGITATGVTTSELVVVPHDSEGQRIEVSHRAIKLANLITEDKDPYILALKAIAASRYDEAIATLNEAEKKKEGDLASIYLALGIAQRYAGRYAEAHASFKKGLTISRKDVDLLDEAALTASLIDKNTQSEDYYRKAIKIKTNLFGSEHPELVPTLEGYADLLLKVDKVGKANLIRLEAEQIRAKVVVIHENQQ